MHTGYDNFWMHKNSRLKPVQNLPQNDNYSCALTTDSYNKQMQSGGCPSHYAPPQNNGATSQAKDHYQNNYNQSLWPSSVYSYPFTPYYGNNMPPQQSFYSHTNNFVYSSPNPQVQEKHNFTHLEMSNGNVNLTMPNTSTSNLTANGLAHAQNNKNTNPQMPRIRVKDVFSLNNKNVQIQLESDGHFGSRQQQQKEAPPGCATHCTRALEAQAQAQTEYIRFNNANMVETSSSSHRFEHRAANQTCSNSQEQYQNSCTLFQQNSGFSSGNFEFSGGRQMGNSLSSESFRTATTSSLLTQLLSQSQESVVERGLQNRQGNPPGGQGNTQLGHGGEQVPPNRNVLELQGTNYSRPCGLNEGAPENRTNVRNVGNAHCDRQKTLSSINDVNVRSSNSVPDTQMSKNSPSVISKSPPHKESNNQQSSLIKITIPHTGQTSFIKVRYDAETNSTKLCKVTASDQNSATDRNTRTANDEERVARSPEIALIPASPASEGGTGANQSSVPPTSKNSTPSPRNPQGDKNNNNQRVHRKEFDALSNKEGNFVKKSTEKAQNLPELTSPREDSAARQERTTNHTTDTSHTPKKGMLRTERPPNPPRPTNHPTDTSLTPKKGILRTERSPNPPEIEELPPPIKAEEKAETVIEIEYEPEPQSPEVVKEAPEELQIEEYSSDNKSECDSIPVSDSEDQVIEVKPLESSPKIKEDVEKFEKDKGRREISLADFKSSINRRKLDLLIQYLKSDLDSSDSSSCNEKMSCLENGNGNEDSCRRRRKLNKASIVRNKNNSREMISIKSLKSSNLTCGTSQITERSKNINKTEDGKSSSSKDKVTTKESTDAAKERAKSTNPCKESKAMKDESRENEFGNEIECLTIEEEQDSSEKTVPEDRCSVRDDNAVISTVLALQNQKTHFCVNCNLVLSIESFWVNAVCGEVRCLNCFNRMSLKAKGKVFKSNDLDGSSARLHRKKRRKTEKENKSRDSGTGGEGNCCDEGKRKRSSKCEEALRKLNFMKENVRKELLEIFLSTKHVCRERRETTSCSCHKRRQSSSGERVHSQKGKHSEEKVAKTEKPPPQSSSSEGSAKRRLSETETNQGVKEASAKRKRMNSSGEDEVAKKERHSSSNKHGVTSTLKEQSSEDENLVKSEKSHGKRPSKSPEEEGASKSEKSHSRRPSKGVSTKEQSPEEEGGVSKSEKSHNRRPSKGAITKEQSPEEEEGSLSKSDKTHNRRSSKGASTKEQSPEEEGGVSNSDKSHIRKPSRSEEGSEHRGKKEAKSRRNSDDTGDDSRWHNMSIIEERWKKEAKAKHSTDESKKAQPRESCPGHRDQGTDEAAKKSSKHETSDKSKNQNSRKEVREHHKPKPAERRDSSASDGLTKSSPNPQNGAQNQKRTESTDKMKKKKNSDEDFSPAKKPHTWEEYVKRDGEQATQPSRSSEVKAPKEMDALQKINSWKARILAEKAARSDASKEACSPFGEHLRKEAKPNPEMEKQKMKKPWNRIITPQREDTSEAPKVKETGFGDLVRRKSKDESRGPQKGIGPRRGSDSSEGSMRKSSDDESPIPKARILAHVIGRGRRESLENREKKKIDEKEGTRFPDKVAKTPSTVLDGAVKSPGKDGHPRRPSEDATRVFGEKQIPKTSFGAPYGN